jgi:hypothetical protein
MNRPRVAQKKSNKISATPRNFDPFNYDMFVETSILEV